MTIRNGAAGQRAWLLAIVAVAFLGAGAMQALAAGDADAQNPDTIRGIVLDAGYYAALVHSQSDRFYYRAEYKGKLLREEGTPFQYTNLNLPSTANEASLTSAGGDTHELKLRLDSGAVQPSGGIFDALGLKPFKLPGAFLQNLRGVGELSGTQDGKQFNFAGGIETAPLHPLAGYNRSQRAGITNWVAFGAVGERRTRDASEGGNQDVALATYRAYFGRAFGWRRSSQYQQVAATLAADALKRAPTYEAGKAVVEAIRATKTKATHIETVIYDVAREIKDQIAASNLHEPVKDDDWETRIHSHSLTYARDRVTNPMHALAVETSGWYTLSGSPDVRRFQNVFAATWTWWLDPQSSDKLKLQLRYENGFERADPLNRKHFLGIVAEIRM